MVGFGHVVCKLPFLPLQIFLRVIKQWWMRGSEIHGWYSHAWRLRPPAPSHRVLCRRGRYNLSRGAFSFKLPRWDPSQWCSNSTTACLAAEKAHCSYYTALGKISNLERMDFQWSSMWVQNWLGRKSVVALSNGLTSPLPCTKPFSFLLFCPTLAPYSPVYVNGFYKTYGAVLATWETCSFKYSAHPFPMIRSRWHDGYMHIKQRAWICQTRTSITNVTDETGI